jgi:hypothetical protein
MSQTPNKPSLHLHPPYICPIAPSWQVYLDTMLLGKGNVDQAMILDVTGAVLAGTADFGFLSYEAEVGYDVCGYVLVVCVMCDDAHLL